MLIEQHCWLFSQLIRRKQAIPRVIVSNTTLLGGLGPLQGFRDYTLCYFAIRGREWR